jgi:hypothetical protein
MARYHSLGNICFASMLAACAAQTSKGFDKVMSNYVGEDINNVVKTLGPASRAFDLPNGEHIYVWMIGKTEKTAAVLTDDKSWTGYSPGGKAQTLTGGGTGTCRIDLTVNVSHIITAYRFEGDSCVARE